MLNEKRCNEGQTINLNIAIKVFIHIMNFPLSLPPSYTKCFKTEVAQSVPRRGVTEEVPAVGFCLGSGLFGSYNSD